MVLIFTNNNSTHLLSFMGMRAGQNYPRLSLFMRHNPISNVGTIPNDTMMKVY